MINYLQLWIFALIPLRILILNGGKDTFSFGPVLVAPGILMLHLDLERDCRNLHRRAFLKF